MSARTLSQAFVVVVLVPVLVFGQAVPAQEPRTDLPAAVLRVTTRLVLVDVVVTDKDGRPVTGLTRDDFTLFEDGEPQTISTFVFESPAGRAGDPYAPPPLPENVYTNRSEYRMPHGPVTLLLLDALNTPLVDQSFARLKMLEYLSTQLLPNQRTAILALTTDLLLLQDFTTDPALLRAALDKYSPQSSVALAREEPRQELPGAVAELLPPETLEAIERFETERSAEALDSRVTTTVSALRVIARAVAGYPGRKNLVWISTAFPFSFTPESDNNYDLLRFYSDDIRRTAGVLSDAQVAVYPVDARGLVGSLGAQLPTAAESGRVSDRVPVGNDAGAEMDRRTTPILDTQQTMKQIAEATGGRAFLNRNDIDRAVTLAVEDGSTYYTLGFYSKDEVWDNKFRRLRVAVNRPGLNLHYRRGYYAVNPVEALQERKKSTLTGEDDKTLREVQLRAALSNPLPATAVTFRVGVLPRAAQKPARVEFRFMVDVQTISFTEMTETRRYDLDILAVAFDSAGKAVASSYHTVESTIEPEQYERLKQVGLPYAMELQLPPGRYHLRMVVRDNRTGLVGTADVPVTLEEPKS